MPACERSDKKSAVIAAFISTSGCFGQSLVPEICFFSLSTWLSTGGEPLSIFQSFSSVLVSSTSFAPVLALIQALFSVHLHRLIQALMQSSMLPSVAVHDPHISSMKVLRYTPHEPACDPRIPDRFLQGIDPLLVFFEPQALSDFAPAILNDSFDNNGQHLAYVPVRDGPHFALRFRLPAHKGMHQSAHKKDQCVLQYSCAGLPSRATQPAPSNNLNVFAEGMVDVVVPMFTPVSTYTPRFPERAA